MQRYEHAALLSNKRRQISIRFDHHLIYSNIDPGSILGHFSCVASCMFSSMSSGSVAVSLSSRLGGVGLWQSLHAGGQLLRIAVTVDYTPQIYSSIAPTGLLNKLLSQYCL